MAEGFFIAAMYASMESTLVKMLEKTAFVGWYGLDSTLDPGTALFLWKGFDFINHCYFWDLANGNFGCGAAH
jgi:hypothetical protein